MESFLYEIILKTDDSILNAWNNDYDKTFTISIKRVDKDEHKVIVDKKIDIVKCNKRNNIVEHIIQNNIHDGEYQLTIRDKIYKMEVINYYNNMRYSKNTFIGNDTPDESMLVVKYHKT